MCVGGWLAFKLVQRALPTDDDWTSTSTVMPSAPIDGIPAPDSVRFDALVRADPAFSRVLLEDFLHELYVRAHQARGDVPAMSRLAPYLAPSVRAELLSRGRGAVVGVGQVVVGSATVTSLALGRENARLGVSFETNYTEVYAGDDRPTSRIYAREQWTLVRSILAHSRAPDELRAFNCPSCGAPIDPDHTAACRQCGVSFERGDHEWRVTKCRIVAEVTVPPTLGGYAPERGTDRPTVFDAGLTLAMLDLRGDDPSFDAEQFRDRVRMIYDRLNAAWSSLRWEDVRPYCTDRFWRAQTYWIDAYRDQQLRNRMDDAHVDRIELVKVTLDSYYRAITVRIFATAIDTTVHARTGRLVGGAREPRAYSEYWTFVRSAERVGPASTAATCPSCSAPLAVGMAGTCDHCGVKLTGGAFDWVLSTIEQDDVYRG